MGFKDEAPGAAAGGKKGMAAVVGAHIGAEIAPAEMNKVVPVVEKNPPGRPAGKITIADGERVVGVVTSDFKREIDMTFIDAKKEFGSNGAFVGELLKLGLEQWKKGKQ